MSQQSFLILGGDPEESVDLAYTRSDATWHISSITGDEKWMKKSPEIYYAVPGHNNDWMKEQFNFDIKPFGKLEDTQLRVDPESNPQQPEYLITHKLQGFEVPLVDKEGNILTWNPDWNIHSAKVAEEIEKKREEFLQKESISQARDELESIKDRRDASEKRLKKIKERI